jgi:hypothetical protein
VPALSCNDHIESAVCEVPGLKGRHLDRKPTLARPFGHTRVGLDAKHTAAGRLELSGGDPSATAHVEHVGAWLAATIRSTMASG